MITSRLYKQTKKSDMLVQLSVKQDLPEAITEFIKTCRMESITFKRTNIPSYQVSFFYITGKKEVSFEEVEMSDIPTELEHAMTILYMNSENEAKISLPDRPGVRTLLLRENLEPKYSLDYQCECTGTKKQSYSFLCQMCVSFLNKASNRDVEFYDTKTDEIARIKRNDQNILKDTWLNFMYQVPGLGKEKTMHIVEAFPTYQSILNDYQGKQTLKDLVVGKSPLGKNLATRIYKVFLGKKYMESVVSSYS